MAELSHSLHLFFSLNVSIFQYVSNHTKHQVIGGGGVLTFLSFRQNAASLLNNLHTIYFICLFVIAPAEHPLVDAHADTQIDAYLDNIRTTIARCVQAMPTHAAYLAETGARAAQP